MSRAAVAFSLMIIAGCGDSLRHEITNCQGAAFRAGEKYKKEDGWHTKEIHFNPKLSKCYLSLEGIERPPDAGPNYSLLSVVVDVDENREIASCVMQHVEGQKDTWVCADDGKEIDAGKFMDLRSKYMERSSN